MNTDAPFIDFAVASTELTKWRECGTDGYSMTWPKEHVIRQYNITEKAEEKEKEDKVKDKDKE